MRTDVRRAGVAVAIAAALALTACTPPADGHNPSPSPSVTPLFSSDEEALAAAEEAYAAYLRVSDQITIEGGQDPERIDPFVGEALKKEIYASFAKYTERGVHTAGSSTIGSMEVQAISGGFSSSIVIHTYVCLDVSSVRVIGADGVDVTPSSRQEVIPLTVHFSAASRSGNLLIDGSESWTGDNFCE